MLPSVNVSPLLTLLATPDKKKQQKNRSDITPDPGGLRIIGVQPYILENSDKKTGAFQKTPDARACPDELHMKCSRVVLHMLPTCKILNR